MLFWMGEEKPEFQGIVQSFEVSGCGDEWCTVLDSIQGDTWEWYIEDPSVILVCPD